MGISQKSITIGEESFVIQSLPASKGIEAAVALSHVMAGAAEGIGGTKIDFFDTEMNYGKIMAGMFNRLSISGTPTFVKDLILLSVILPEALADQKQDWFEDKFAGNYANVCFN